MAFTHCKGWWEQDGYGRQLMHDLTMTFAGQEFVGRGIDCVGDFTLSGRLEGNDVQIVKEYVGRHKVLYAGVQDGEGTMSGLWSIHEVGGKWLIKVNSTIGGADEIRIITPGDLPQG